MSAKSNKVLENPEFVALVRRDLDLAVQQIVEKALGKYREALVQQLKAHLQDRIVHGDFNATSPNLSDLGDWIGIESLSRLRSVVGGRFQNIKKKWTDAGFPLREHRGDRVKGFSVKDHAWIELSNWILKQGYESRLTPDSDQFLFELRAVPK